MRLDYLEFVLDGCACRIRAGEMAETRKGVERGADDGDFVLGDDAYRSLQRVGLELVPKGVLRAATHQDQLLGLERADVFKLSQLVRLNMPAYCGTRYMLRTLAQWRRDGLARFSNDNSGRKEA